MARKDTDHSSVKSYPCYPWLNTNQGLGRYYASTEDKKAILREAGGH